jgi:hypothetical protein
MIDASCSNVAPSASPGPRLLEQNHRFPSAPGAQQLQQSVRDQRQAVRIAPCRIAARVQDDTQQTERLRAIDLVSHGFERLLPQRRARGREVDQVAGVRDDRTDPDALSRLRNSRISSRGIRRTAPLIGVLGENLQGVTAMHDRAFDRAR